MSLQTETHDFLVEIGTEELPPTALLKLSNSFTAQVIAGINAAELKLVGYVAMSLIWCTWVFGSGSNSLMQWMW